MTRQELIRQDVHVGPHLREAATVAVDLYPFERTFDAPRVSVVVPNYNHGHYAVDLLPALARQTFVGESEVIVVDDGSTEDSWSQIKPLADRLGLPGKLVRLKTNRGRSVARNVGILNAAAPLIAFTDADCIPDDGWLDAGIRCADHHLVGVVQGVTLPRSDQPKPFFNHFIEIRGFDGTFSTCNIFYEKRLLLEADGFDPAVVYWEDLDLGWRVSRLGAEAALAEDAIVYHQIMQLQPLQWLAWPSHYCYMPEKARNYPEYRRYLYLGAWVSQMHLLFDLALVGIVLGLALSPWLWLLLVPYAAVFPFKRGLSGKWPVAKALLHVGWDAVSFWVLLTSSIRHRSLVL